MSYPERPLGDALALACDTVEVQADGSYEIAGVYGFGRGLFDRERITGTDTRYKILHRLHAGALVLSKLKAFEGAITLVPDRFDGKYLSPEFPTFALDSSQSDARYLRHLCAWPQLWARLAAKSTGIGSRRERVSPRQLLSTSVPLPDMAEQSRVASKLDALTSRLDGYDRFRQAQLTTVANTLNSAATRLAAEAPSKALIGDLLRSARNPAAIDLQLKYRAFGMRGFGRGSIRYPEVPASELSKLRYFTFPPNALVLSNIKAWEGAIGITSVEDTACVASSRFLFYVPKDDRIVDVGYLAAYFLSPVGLAQISAASPGGADRNRTLSSERFEKISVPLPPINEQRRLARAAGIAQRVSAAARRAQTTASAARTALLDAAFTAKL